jgi:hypothetical protein
MRIEDSPYQFNSASPLEKLRTAQSSLEITLEDLDLSFLDLLTAVASDTKGDAQKQAEISEDKTAAKDKTTATTVKDRETPGKLTLLGKVSNTSEADEAKTQVDKDMVLFKDELSDIDQQYMKQVLIPGLPILMGSVPFQSVFPTGKDGGISYKGFDVSPQLAELIEKGYKTGRPIRVELDPNSAVVLKIRNGQVSAEFVSTDKAAAFIMQQELDDLRNRMASRNLPVGTLEYKYRDPAQQSGGNARQNDEDENAD